MDSLRNLRFTLYLLLIIYKIQAQVIPQSRQVDWSVAGYQGSLPELGTIVDVTDFGGTGNGITDNFSAIANAINFLNGTPGIIYFPEGTYLVGSSISVPSGVILKGESSGKTSLKFDLNSSAQNCLNITSAQTGSFIPLTSSAPRGATIITVSNALNFSAGEYAEIRQQNGSWDVVPASWANYSVGQIVKISAVSGTNLTLEKPLRTDLSASLNPEIRKLNPVREAGIEYLKIIRAHDPGPSDAAGYNIYFQYAANCYVKSVESEKSIGSHILADASTNVEITGCYFHEAFSYNGTATRGYGVTLIQHTGECLVENNIFRMLRHAMMVKQGANGNVFGYNYSTEPNRSEPVSNLSSDISLHGHYPFANLFEGNIVQNIFIDSTWGPSGPNNTFFRNRAEAYGILIANSSVTSDSQNFVGNEITKTLNCLVTAGQTCQLYEGVFIKAGAGHFEYANNIKYNAPFGIIEPYGTSSLTDDSYYLKGTSTLSIDDSSPSIGPPAILGSGSNDAKTRYETDPVKTYPEPSSLPVELIHFSGRYQKNKVLLTWRTSLELNNSHFTLEKSSDGLNFTPFVRVPSQYSEKRNSPYTADDPMPFPNYTFYRLKQTDLNGASKYCKTINVASKEAEKDFVIFPNPSKTLNIHIQLQGFEEEELDIKIHDLYGEIKLHKKIFLLGNRIVISQENLTPGVYSFTISNKSCRISKSVVIH